MRPRGAAPSLTFFAALALAAAAAAFAWAAEAEAQCALCRTALQDAGEATARAMNTGILVLLIPPVAIFCTIFAVAYRKGKEAEETRDDER